MPDFRNLPSIRSRRTVRALHRRVLRTILACGVFAGWPHLVAAQTTFHESSAPTEKGASILSQSNPSADQQQVIDVITTLFAALRDGDSAKLHSIVAPDFYLFDNGLRMDADSVLAMIDKAKSAGSQFTWTVTEPDVHIEHDFAWIAYVNVGCIASGSVTQDQKWLESGVLNKQSGKWKIAFMHSTRVPAGNASAREDHK